eukprot:178001-Pelagomonas_calceolata.AAC.1
MESTRSKKACCREESYESTGVAAGRDVDDQQCNVPRRSTLYLHILIIVLKVLHGSCGDDHDQNFQSEAIPKLCNVSLLVYTRPLLRIVIADALLK